MICPANVVAFFNSSSLHSINTFPQYYPSQTEQKRGFKLINRPEDMTKK